MTIFLRLLEDQDKATALRAAVSAHNAHHVGWVSGDSRVTQQAGTDASRVFEVDPESFRQIPGAPFAYWVSEGVRGCFQRLPAFESNGNKARIGMSTSDDTRFLRCSWEIHRNTTRKDNTAWKTFDLYD